MSPLEGKQRLRLCERREEQIERKEKEERGLDCEEDEKKKKNK